MVVQAVLSVGLCDLEDPMGLELSVVAPRIQTGIYV